MPLTPAEYEQICTFLDIVEKAGNRITMPDLKEYLSKYVEEPKIVTASTDLTVLLAQAEADSMKQQARRHLEQQGKKEEATGAAMAEVVSESETPTYTPIAEGVPEGAYLPLGDIVYQLKIEGGKKKLYENKEQTERFRKQRSGNA